MIQLDLDPHDRQALIDVAHAQLMAVRERAAVNAAEERRWLRVTATLIAMELDPEDPDPGADTGGEAV